MLHKKLEATQARVEQYRAKAKGYYSAKLEQGKLVKDKAEQTYRRYEKYIPIIAFVGGFIYDSLTLTRIDLMLDNLMLLGYTIVAGVLLALWGAIKRRRMRQPWLLAKLDWIVFGINFLFGSLLSSYVVFYFKSAGVGKSYLFVGMLVALMVANEFWSHRFQNFAQQLSVYFFCAFAFLTFFLPVLTHRINFLMFLLSGILALLLTALVAFGMFGKVLLRAKAATLRLSRGPVAIFVGLVLLYLLNWIPPVPLALKESGIYRSVKRVQENYQVTYRQPAWWQVLTRDESDFAYTRGDTVFCFAAIFAPTDLSGRIVHHWQMKNKDGDWVTTDKIGYAIRGGRDGGWRGFTRKTNATPGEWRVEVKTDNERLLGRIPIDIAAAQTRPTELKTELR